MGGLYLADMGADVVKVESPQGGDATRSVYGAQYGSEAAVFVTVNRNKRSVAIDLAKPDGRAAFLRLAGTADVILEAYKGGVAERLGIDYQLVRTGDYLDAVLSKFLNYRNDVRANAARVRR